VKTAWYVEDDGEMLQAVKLMLQLLDYEAKGYLSALQAARSLIEENPPDIMILDINMPKVTGIEFLQFIRSERRWDHLPVIMLSTEVADAKINEALALGADGYLCKPVTVEELEDKINSAIQKRVA
jgi:DNA-binding response OmpR family regulator